MVLITLKGGLLVIQSDRIKSLKPSSIKQRWSFVKTISPLQWQRELGHTISPIAKALLMLFGKKRVSGDL